MKKLRVLLCDDHAIIRDGLRTLINLEPDMEVVGEAVSGEECVELAKQLAPDVILMDINLPDFSGAVAVQHITREVPGTRVIMLTMYQEEEYLFQTIRAGASGYIVKDAPFEEVVLAIRKIVGGKSFLHIHQAATVAVTPSDSTSAATDRLSPRECEVLTRLVTGLTNREIAEELVIAEVTVKLHTTNIYRKLGVKSRSQAIMVAIRDKLVVL